MTNTKANLESLFNDIKERELLNGTVLVAKKGEILYEGAFGDADLSTNRPLTSRSVFNLASVSKPITATAILLLVQEGKLSLDDYLNKWIPDLPYEGITIRHLLNHTNGLPDYLDLFEVYWDKAKIADNDDLLRYLIKYKPERLFAPNERVEYSNTGYILLAIIVERITDMDFSDFLQENIFKPLKMTRTQAIGVRKENIEIDDYAYGYVYDVYAGEYILADDFEESKMVTYLDGMLGDGGIQSTVRDLYLYERALSSGNLINDELLKEAYKPAVTETETPFKYGFGWILEDDKEKGQIIWHSGGWPGYVTHLKRFIDHDIVVIVLRNKEQDFDFHQQVLHAIEQAAFDEPYELAEEKPSLERAQIIPEDVLKRLVGDYALTEHPDLIIHVFLENNRLFIEMPGSMKLELYAKTEENFFLRGLSIDVDFITVDGKELVKIIDGTEVQTAERQ
ncbi:class A beta-lactamase-related serine hydrolase [Siminovitchia terrae]|uniref:Class A beta-lactamase-related serine hydrolase n=1 Tax=Siminovitchia terrae TaxID=1914933 RepID=A0A429XAB0_SIMTE|nr:serine hydrolase domain-containing protein [Siminovitchia terrae]RST59993.1 class A beta-lactamase-related serine hydrolase [Siminovitchia terrae]